MAPRERRGLTLIELLVVMAIIGVLVALLMSAIQDSRESARRMSCQNNLKQIGLALHNFHDVYGKFPPGHSHDPSNISESYGQPGPPDNLFYISWMARILPFAEQKALHEGIQPGAFAWPHGEAVYDGKYINGVSLSIYRCPSDAGPKSIIFEQPGEPAFEVATGSYLGVSGQDQFLYDGILFVNSTVKMADVTDGLSNTIMVGERPPAYEGMAGWWFAGSGLYPWFGAVDVVLGADERVAVDWACTPDGPRCSEGPGGDCFRPGSLNDPNGDHAWHFWSFHRGGANFTLADGSVRLIHYTQPDKMLRELSTRAGSEPIQW